MLSTLSDKHKDHLKRLKTLYCWKHDVQYKKKTLTTLDQELLDLVTSDDGDAQGKNGGNNEPSSSYSQHRNRFDKDECDILASEMSIHKTLVGAHSNKITEEVKNNLWQEVTDQVNQAKPGNNDPANSREY